jgi:YHS domain-containing protein
MSTRRAFLWAVAATAAFGGMTAAIPVVAQTGPATDRLGLKGYDPVAYFTLAAPTPGIAEYEVVWDGVRYRFANARHRDMFKANPEKYAPQFGGLCAMTMANGSRREPDPTIWLIANGNLYVFSGIAGQERFRLEAQVQALRAAANWKTLKDTPSQ